MFVVTQRKVTQHCIKPYIYLPVDGRYPLVVPGGMLENTLLGKLWKHHHVFTISFFLDGGSSTGSSGTGSSGRGTSVSNTQDANAGQTQSGGPVINTNGAPVPIVGRYTLRWVLHTVHLHLQLLRASLQLYLSH